MAITQENQAWLAIYGFRILGGHERLISRSLRRFLINAIDGEETKLLSLQYAKNEGFSAAQIKELASYARAQFEKVRPYRTRSLNRFDWLDL